MTALGSLVIRFRLAVLIGAGALLVLAGIFGGGVAGRLSGGGFDDPHSESSRARAVLDQQFHAGQPNLLLLVSAPAGVDSPTAAAAGEALTARLAAEPAVANARSYWSTGASALRSRDGTEALVAARIRGGDDAVAAAAEVLAPRYTGRFGPLTVRVGGTAQVYREISDRIEHDLTRAESVAVPVTAVLLVLVFGSAVAALLPLAIGGVAVLGTFAVLRALTEVTDVSIFALNLTTGLGLGLAIDYSLFVVSRYREELGRGRTPADAVAETVRTAGRTVLFSAFTVALSLAAMLIFPLFFLRSFAYAGIAVVALAATAAVVLLPAILVVLGPRVNRFALWRRPEVAPARSPWHRLALGVMRRPVPVGAAVLVVLLALGAPFLGVRFGLSDDRVLPRGANGHLISQALRTDFPSRESETLSVVSPTAGASAVRSLATASYAVALSRVAGVARVDAGTGSYRDGRLVAPGGPAAARFGNGRGSWLSVVPAVESYSPAGERLARDLRAVPAPYAVKVGGPAAELVDTEAALFHRVPLAGVLIATAMVVLLFLFSGSVVVPAKALVLNLLSLTATFGAMVFVFQDGHLRWLVGDFLPTGTLDTTTPILMFCTAFGLSMDYEVFLLSRIKEEYDRTGDNTAAVALGLARTGPIVSAAAALIAIVFLSFASSGISFIKLLGVGLALAVVMDATLVRGLLVPAFMRLAGRANWWAPTPLRRLHERIGLAEHGQPAPVPARRPATEPTALR